MKILYVTTISITMNFFVEHIKMLKENGNIVELASNSGDGYSERVLELKCQTYNLPFSRNPLCKSNYIAYKALKNLIADGSYDIVHTHTPNASALVRLACKKMRKSGLKVLYTAHGFHFYKGAPIKNWLLYYPIEKWLSKYTDVLITINQEDYDLAAKKFCAIRVEKVNGVGININKFIDLQVDQLSKRKEIEIPTEAFLLLSVGELNKNKNHEVVIRALSMIDNDNIYYIICGSGMLDDYLQKIIEEFGLENRVKLLGFRNDVAELYAISDLFVFPSFREGLSVSLMEAMASGLPCVVSDIRGNRDLVNDEGGFLVSPSRIDLYVESIQKVISNELAKENFRKRNINFIQDYYMQNVLSELGKIYGV